MWEKEYSERHGRWLYTIRSDSFTVELTGGSARILKSAGGELLKEYKGHNYLYTGDIHPDESEFFALENGKHFYVYSLKTLELIRRITLPKNYISVDVCGFYSTDGKVIRIPACRYVYEDKAARKGHYEYDLFTYRVGDYALIDKMPIKNKKDYEWEIIERKIKEIELYIEQELTRKQLQNLDMGGNEHDLQKRLSEWMLQGGDAEL